MSFRDMVPIIGKCLIKQRNFIYTTLDRFCSRTAILTLFMIVMLIAAMLNLEARKKMERLLGEAYQQRRHFEAQNNPRKYIREYPITEKHDPVDNVIKNLQEPSQVKTEKKEPE